jgi:hypothetical protein
MTLTTAQLTGLAAFCSALQPETPLVPPTNLVRRGELEVAMVVGGSFGWQR